MKRANLSWPGVIVVGGSTILSWLAGTPRLFPTAAAPAAAPTTAAARADRTLPAIALHDWQHRTESRARPARDIFSFDRSPAPAPPPPPPPSAGFTLAPEQQRSTLERLFRLIGFAEDGDASAPTRTAIIAGQGQVYLVAEGDTVAFVYRVTKMTANGVELVDTTDGGTVRLTLK